MRFWFSHELFSLGAISTCKISSEKKKCYPVSEKLHAVVRSDQQRAEKDKCPGPMLAAEALNAGMCAQLLV